MKPKRYLLFSGDGLSPRGGADDFVGSFDSIDDCVSTAKKLSDDITYNGINEE